jgi:acetyl-CoA carboxylase carboxyl transferase subunit alpha
MISYLEFEKPVAALEARIAELRQTAQHGDVDLASEIRRLEVKSADLLAEDPGRPPPDAAAFLRLCCADVQRFHALGR